MYFPALDTVAGVRVDYITITVVSHCLYIVGTQHSLFSFVPNRNYVRILPESISTLCIVPKHILFSFNVMCFILDLLFFSVSDEFLP